MTRIVVFHEDHDWPATWLAGRLAARGYEVDAVSGSALAAATGWTHRLGIEPPAVRVRLADGRVLGQSTGGAVINRLGWLPQTLAARLSGPDGDYARQEMFALLLSALHALPGLMLGRPSPQGLSGAWRHPSHWMLLAREAGLPLGGWQQSASDDPNAPWQQAPAPGTGVVLAAGSGVIDPLGLDPGVIEGCRDLAKASGAGLLGLRFARGDDGTWRFAGADLQPDLAQGGEPLVDLVCAELRL